MKTLRKLAMQNRGWVIISFAVTLIFVGLQFSWTINIGNLADSIVERSTVMRTFLWGMVVLMFGNSIFQYLNQLVNRFCSEKMAHTLRMNFADSILSGKAGEGQPGGYEAMSKVQNELMQASEYMSNTLFDIIGMTLSGLLTLLFLLTQNALLTGIILVPIIIVVFITNRLGKKVVPLAHASYDKKTEHNKIAYSAITGYDTAALYAAEGFFTDKYEAGLEDWAKVEAKKERINAVCNSFSGILSQIPLLILFAAGVILIEKGRMTIGVLIIFLNMIKGLLRTIMNFPSWMVSVRNFLVHLSRADLEAENETEEKKGKES